MSTLAGGVAHDFNNLLTGIFGFVDLAKHLITNDKALSFLQRALDIMERAKNLSKQLLTFAKGDVLLKSQIDLEKLLYETTLFVLSGSNVTFSLDVDDDVMALFADKNQISQAFDNIIINARQSMPEGGHISIHARRFNAQSAILPGTLSSSLSKDKEYVEIAISDNGTGIHSDIIHKIFDPFFTTKGIGSGLGLAITYSIVKKHGGEIDVVSCQGKGTTFFIYLPFLDKIEESVSREANDKQVFSPEKNDETRILILDDEEYICTLAKELLCSLGYKSDCFYDGKNAIQAYQSAMSLGHRYNAVILDLTIRGGLGGLKTLERLKEIDPLVKAIASSGYADDPVLADPKKYGFSDVLKKPYTMDDMTKLFAPIKK